MQRGRTTHLPLPSASAGQARLAGWHSCAGCQAAAAHGGDPDLRLSGSQWCSGACRVSTQLESISSTYLESRVGAQLESVSSLSILLECTEASPAGLPPWRSSLLMNDLEGKTCRAGQGRGAPGAGEERRELGGQKAPAPWPMLAAGQLPR